jgi:hypothetical protein
MILLLAMAVAAPLGTLGELTFTEFQSDTQYVAEYYGEWFEIYNNSGANQDLMGVEIRNSTDDGQTWQTHTISSSLLVAAGDYVVLGVSNELDTGEANWNGNVTVDYVYPFYDTTLGRFDMSSSQSWMQIWTSDGILLDEVKWDPSWGFNKNYAHQVGPNSSALEWSNDFPDNWCPSETLIPGSLMYGTPGASNEYCAVNPSEDLDGDGWTKLAGDCRDDDPYVNPDAVDAGTGVYENTDDDCDGIRDDGETDDDGDGFTEVAGDCNDESALVYPGVTETVNDRDDDCNGCIDDLDLDGDGYTECDEDGDGRVDDCSEGNANINPSENETPYDGLDQNCDLLDFCDVDGDGYGSIEAANPDLCEVPTERVTDCDDVNPNINPGTPEVPADGLDNDCDGIIDIPDQDDDGYTVDDGDCMDISEESLGDNEDAAAIVALAASVHPGAEEICGDLIDNDCNGFADDAESCWNPAGTATVRGGGMFCGYTTANPSLFLLPLAAFLLRRRR